MKVNHFFALLLLSVSSQVLANDQVSFYSIREELELDVQVTPTFKAHLSKDEVGSLKIQLSGKEQQLTKLEDLPGEEFPIQIADFNFDGFADIAIGEEAGYMGLNWFYNVYLFDSKSVQFIKKIMNLGAQNGILVDAANKQISGTSKSGPDIIGVGYCYNAKGLPYSCMESKSITGSDLVAKTYKSETGALTRKIVTDNQNNLVKAQVSAEKAFLYTTPVEASKTKSYLIKGDQVAVSDLGGAHNQWALVEYVGAKITTKWLPTKSLTLMNPNISWPGSQEVSGSE